MIQCTLDMLLMHYAAGSLEPAEALIAAAHLKMNPAARKKLAQYEAVGGHMMAQMPAAEVSDECLKAVMALIDAPPQPAPQRAPCTPDTHQMSLPECIHALLNDHCDDFSLNWQDAGGGIEVIDLKVRDAKACSRKVTLLRAQPNSTAAKHRHPGIEITVVLNGSYRDGNTLYQPGDIVIIHDPKLSHAPAADTMGCLCLVMTDDTCGARLRDHVKGLFGRLFKRFG